MNAIVTGATKGIGLAIVNQLAANNYNLALCSRNADNLMALISDLTAAYPEQKFFGTGADMEKEEEVRKFAGFAMDKLGTIDVLINNAGLFIPKSLGEEDLFDLQRQLAVNVQAPYILSKQIGSQMVMEGNGHIINICSVASIEEVSTAASYTISKTALLSLTRILRQDYQTKGVKVTAIIPGSTLTDSWAGTDIPADRFVQADDIAEAVLSCLKLSSGANIDELVIRPKGGDI